MEVFGNRITKDSKLSGINRMGRVFERSEYLRWLELWVNQRLE